MKNTIIGIGLWAGLAAFAIGGVAFIFSFVCACLGVVSTAPAIVAACVCGVGLAIVAAIMKLFN